jgi:hypothetical protein
LYVINGKGERRTSDRFPINRELRYKVLDRRGTISGKGLTVNMSSSGLLFTTEHKLLPGQKVELAVSWPAQLDHRCALKFLARGRVVRTESGRAAVEIDHYEFRTAGTQGLTL